MSPSQIFQECLERYEEFGYSLTHLTTSLALNYRADVALACLKAVKKGAMMKALQEIYLSGKLEIQTPPRYSLRHRTMLRRWDAEIRERCGEEILARGIWPLHRYLNHQPLSSPLQ